MSSDPKFDRARLDDFVDTKLYTIIDDAARAGSRPRRRKEAADWPRLAFAGLLAIIGFGAVKAVDANKELVVLEAGPARSVSEAFVTDGDSLRIGETRVRLHGIDAPEARQTCLDAAGQSWTCGQAATSRMRQLVAGGVSCTIREMDRYGRQVATCRAGDRDVAETLVAEGLAVAYRRFSTEYVAAENAARQARRGIWAGTFEMPEDWRARNR